MLKMHAMRQAQVAGLRAPAGGAQVAGPTDRPKGGRLDAHATDETGQPGPGFGQERAKPPVPRSG